MAHFIKLTDGTGPDPVRYVNINNITQFFKEGVGSIVVLTSLNEDGFSDYVPSNETPDQILALIAEAQGAK